MRTVPIESPCQVSCLIYDDESDVPDWHCRCACGFKGFIGEKRNHPIPCPMCGKETELYPEVNPKEGTLEAALYELDREDSITICFRKGWVKEFENLPTKNTSGGTVVPFESLTAEDRSATDWSRWFCGTVIPCCFRGRFG